jgi:NTP pyrophosphatase (non-canonical NTP hydrolase)
MTIQEMQDRCFENAKKLGWADKPVPVPEMIALIHSEASEALESFRDHEPTSFTSSEGKPEGIGSEFADIIIRVAHYAELLKINLDYEIDRKLTYNLTRGYRHGGKEI